MRRASRREWVCLASFSGTATIVARKPRREPAAASCKSLSVSGLPETRSRGLHAKLRAGPILELLQFGSNKETGSVPAQLPVLNDAPGCPAWALRQEQRAACRPAPSSVWARRLDGLFLHPVWGVLVFGVVVVAVFQAMFSWARPLMDACQWLVSRSGAWIGALLPDSWLRSLVVEGVWGGVGSVVVFLPQILVLFVFLWLLEDSGYLERAAMIADRAMARVGLRGKSFIPLVAAHACATPAILAARSIENKRERIATILIAPLMSCSARLPVYTLVIAAFLPERRLLGPLVGTRAAAILGLYLLGFLAAFGTARLLRSSLLKSDQAPIVLDMLPYRWPTLRSLALRLREASQVFLRRAGTVVLGVTVLWWLLAHWPLKDGHPPPIGESLAGQAGRALEPLIRPLGFNWQIGVGLISSLVTREAIIGTLGTIYAMQPEARALGLQAALRKDLDAGDAAALLVFFALMMPCVSTLAMVRRETGSWKWPLAQFVYMGVLAYAGAFLVSRLVSLLA